MRLSLLALLLSQQSVFALLNLDGSRNQVFVFGSLGLAYDSNIFAQNGSAGDYTESLTIGSDFTRRAGLVAMNASATLSFLRYDRHTDLNAVNPNLLVSFAKSTGRLTGTLSLNAYRTEQADSAVNLHTTSWDIPLSLNLRYPLNDKFYATSETTYEDRRFVDNNAGLSNYADYAEGIDGYYVYTSKLDFLAGYRIRLTRTELGRTTDHNFSLGATGGLTAKVNGTVRFGYQVRQMPGPGASFSQFSALGQLTWSATRKLTVIGLISRDFTTTATAVSVDALSTTLNASYAMTRRFQFGSGLGWGRNRFLGEAQSDRLDNFFSGNANASYSLNEHLKVISSYSYFHNLSTLDLAEFNRQQFSVEVSSRF